MRIFFDKKSWIKITHGPKACNLQDLKYKIVNSKNHKDPKSGFQEFS